MVWIKCRRHLVLRNPFDLATRALSRSDGSAESRRHRNTTPIKSRATHVPTHFDGSRFESLARIMRIGIIDTSRRNGADHWLKDAHW
jgi:hypothetical protein